MLALVSKYAIDATIGGWLKPTYLELKQTHLKISTHLKNSRYQLRNGLIVIAHEYDSAEDGSLSLSFKHMCIKFKHRTGDGVAQNCRCVEESCTTWTEDRAGILLSGNTSSYLGSNSVCC